MEEPIGHSTPPDVIADIAAQQNIDEMLKTDDDLIEISINIEPKMIHEKQLELMDEMFGKIKKSILITLESEQNNECILLWKTKALEKLLVINLDFSFDGKKPAELNSLVRKFIKKSLDEENTCKFFFINLQSFFNNFTFHHRYI